MLLCPVTKKHRHQSQGAAAAHLRSVLAFRPDYAGVVYPCHHCWGWHVGREKNRAHRNKYKKP